MIAQAAEGIANKYSGSALATLLTGGLWREKAKDDVAFPYAVFTEVDDINGATYASDVEFHRIQFSIWAKYSKYTALTIAFHENTPSADTLTDSANGLLTGGFVAGAPVAIYGSTSNDKTVTPSAITAGTMTLAITDDLTAEIAGDSVTLMVTDAQAGLDVLEASLKSLFDRAKLTITSWNNPAMLWDSSRPAYSEDDIIVGTHIDFVTWIDKTR